MALPSWADETPTASFGQVTDVWTSGPTDVWVVGATGRVARRTSSGWAALTSGTFTRLDRVWGSGAGDVWIAGGTFIARWNGTAFVPVTLPTAMVVRGIGGRSANDVYVTGTSASNSSTGVTQHWNGVSWRTVDLGSARAASNVWAGAPGLTWVVGDGVARGQAQ